MTANRTRRKLTVRASLKPRKVVYFFSRTPLKKRGTKHQQAKKIRQVKGTANALKKQGPKSRHVKQIPKVKGTSNALKKRNPKSRHVKQILTVKGVSNALKGRGPKSRRARKSLMVKDASRALYQYRLSNLYINKLVKRGLGQATIAR